MVRILIIDGRPRNQGKEKITTKDINDYEPATSFDSSASVIWRRRLLFGGTGLWRWRGGAGAFDYNHRPAGRRLSKEIIHRRPFYTDGNHQTAPTRF